MPRVFLLRLYIAILSGTQYDLKIKLWQPFPKIIVAEDFEHHFVIMVQPKVKCENQGFQSFL